MVGIRRRGRIPAMLFVQGGCAATSLIPRLWVPFGRLRLSPLSAPRRTSHLPDLGAASGAHRWEGCRARCPARAWSERMTIREPRMRAHRLRSPAECDACVLGRPQTICTTARRSVAFRAWPERRRAAAVEHLTTPTCADVTTTLPGGGGAISGERTARAAECLPGEVWQRIEKRPLTGDRWFLTLLPTQSVSASIGRPPMGDRMHAKCPPLE